MRENNVMRNYYIPSVTETTSRGERTSDLYSRISHFKSIPLASTQFHSF